MKYPLTCQQTGLSESDHVSPPVFAVRNGLDGPIEMINSETSGYDIAAGKLNRPSMGLPTQLFYLVIAIKMKDNNKQFVCVNAGEFRNEESLEDAFLHHRTTIVVSSAEGKKRKLIFSIWKLSGMAVWYGARFVI